MSEYIDEVQCHQMIDQIHHAKVIMQKVMRDVLKDVNLTREQLKVLILIKHETMSQKTLADHMQISEATLSVRVKRLEQLGYVKRLQDPHDKRRFTLQVTDLGHKELEISRERYVALTNRVLQTVTVEEYNSFMAMINRIIDNCQKAGVNDD